MAKEEKITYIHIYIYIIVYREQKRKKNKVCTHYLDFFSKITFVRMEELEKKIGPTNFHAI